MDTYDSDLMEVMEVGVFRLGTYVGRRRNCTTKGKKSKGKGLAQRHWHWQACHGTELQVSSWGPVKSFRRNE
jgi:hypothetical protein